MNQVFFPVVEGHEVSPPFNADVVLHAALPNSHMAAVSCELTPIGTVWTTRPGAETLLSLFRDVRQHGIYDGESGY